MSSAHFCHLQARLSYSLGPLLHGWRSFLSMNYKWMYKIHFTFIKLIHYIVLFLLDILEFCIGSDQDTDHQFFRQNLSVTVWWQRSDQGTDQKYCFSQKGSQVPLGFFPDLSFKGNFVGREFPGFLLSVSRSLSLSPSILFYYWDCFLFWGYLKFWRGAFSGFSLSGVGPIQLCVPSSPPRAARPRTVRVKTRVMKRGPFSVICV